MTVDRDRWISAPSIATGTRGLRRDYRTLLAALRQLGSTRSRGAPCAHVMPRALRRLARAARLPVGDAHDLPRVSRARART